MLSTKNRLLVLVPLFLVLIIDTMGMGLIFPVLSPLFMATSEGILPSTASLLERDFLYGLTLTIYFVFMFFGAPFFGDLSDRLGRKKVLLLCLSGTAFGLAMSAFAIEWGSVWMLLIGRAVAGFAAGSQSIAQASIADISTSNDKVNNISFIILANCIGFILGPMMGGYFADSTIVTWFHYSTPFFVATGLAVINAIALQFTLKETFVPSVKKSLNLFRGLLVFIDGFTHKRIRTLCVILFMLQIGWGLYFLYISLFLAQNYEFNSVQIGHFMAYFGLVWGLSLGVVIRIAVKFFDLRTIVLVAVVLLGVGMLLNLIRHEWIVWISAVPIGLGSALSYSGLISIFSNAVGKDIQGWVMGVGGAIVAAAWGIGGLMAGFIEHISLFFPFEVAAAFVFCSGLFFFLYRPQPVLEEIDHG